MARTEHRLVLGVNNVNWKTLDYRALEDTVGSGSAKRDISLCLKRNEDANPDSINMG